MKRIAAAPIAIALFALAACGSQEASNSVVPGSKVEGKAAPAGTTWSDTVVATPEGGIMMGNPDAPIKLIEFGSYTCPHCAAFNKESHEALTRDYVNTGKVSFEYRNYVANPLDIAVALLARCSGPTAFFPLSNQFFENQQPMIEKIQAAGEAPYQSAMSAPQAQRFGRVAQLAGLVEFAQQRGIPEAKATQCLADMQTAEMMAKVVERDTAKYEIKGTPSLIMNGTTLEVTTWPALVEKLKEAGV